MIRWDLRRERAKGFALVLSLALIVLISFAVVAYFSRTVATRQIQSATASASQAEILARGAAEMVVSDLKTEILAGSEINQPQTTDPPIFRPSDPSKAVPSRVIVASLSARPEFNNLVKQSIGRFFPTSGFGTQAPLITSSTGRDTTVPSQNGRNVSLARWNVPVLCDGAGFTTPDQLPRWILMNRTGIAPTQTWDSTMKDTTPGNNNAVICRFAFNVYDEGGLLDSTVAGTPNFSPPFSNGQLQQLKSTETGGQLFDGTSAIIPGFSSAALQTTFVNTWRFQSNTTTTQFIYDFLALNSGGTFADSGFMRPTVYQNRSNSFAYSRQDLLRATLAGNQYVPLAALPYLTHFTRSLNAPSWYPQQNASDMGGNSSYPYFDTRDDAGATNRNIPNVRVRQSFVRTDGTTANLGDPLIKSRFPLRRLDALTYNGISSGGFYVMNGGALQAPTSVTVQRDFGLIWDTVNKRWNYVGPSGTTTLSSIETLDQIAMENPGREPNFFELLKAFILSGSIGLGSDSTANTFVTLDPVYYQQPSSSDTQIIRIGANIIDQWDGDKNPTFINFGTNEIAGVENLPFLSKIIFQPQWKTNTQFTAWLVPTFWTPAQNGTRVGPQTPTNIPAIRFVMTSGTASATVEGGSGSNSSSSVIGMATQPSVNLTASHDFSNPPDAASSSTSIKVGMTAAPNSRLGIPFTFPPGGLVTKANTTRAYPIINNVTFEMQAQIGGTSGPWKTYQRWSSCNVNTSTITAACNPPTGTLDWGSSTIYDPEFVMLDPRTIRFGVWQNDGASSGDSTDFTRGYNETLDRTSGDFQKITGLGPQGSSFTGVGAEMANNNLSSVHYVDLDGVQRLGDALTGSASSAMLPANTADRPPIFNRQIRTVAELGTISRDQPWKTLNFTSSHSGDAGLLDAFTVFEPNSVFRWDLIAGKLSLNTRQELAIESVLAGIATSTYNNTPTIPSNRAPEARANALVAMTSALADWSTSSELWPRAFASESICHLAGK